MKKVLLAAVVLLALSAVASPAHAARVVVGVGIGGGGPCCGYYPPGWGYYGYPAYYSPYYVAPPPVAYAPPAYYAAPAPVYAAPTTYAAPPPVAADPSGPTFTNEQGQTCREYQSKAVIAGQPQSTYGTACLQPDGSWRIVK